MGGGSGGPRLCDCRFSCSYQGIAAAAVWSSQVCRAMGRLNGQGTWVLLVPAGVDSLFLAGPLPFPPSVEPEDEKLLPLPLPWLDLGGSLVGD